MESQIDPIEPTNSGERIVFTAKTIGICTALFGPLAGTYLISHNFRVFRKATAAKVSYAVGLAATLILIPILLQIPEHTGTRAMTGLIELLWAIPAYVVVKEHQALDIEHHLSGGGKKASGWKAAGIGILAMIILMSYMLFLSVVVFPSEAIELPTFQSSLIETENSHCRVYYDSSALTQADARVVGASLEKMGYFSVPDTEREAVFYRDKNDYLIAISVDERAFSDRNAGAILALTLSELHDRYVDRRYRFRLLVIGPKGITKEKFIPGK
ncbi:MAG TPA: hypothetical protein VMH23_17850 [Bacteroidota bacterium]|nr:hypothetical protein [Bacteroidota bacterium]